MPYKWRLEHFQVFYTWRWAREEFATHASAGFPAYFDAGFFSNFFSALGQSFLVKKLFPASLYQLSAIPGIQLRSFLSGEGPLSAEKKKLIKILTKFWNFLPKLLKISKKTLKILKNLRFTPIYSIYS